MNMKHFVKETLHLRRDYHLDFGWGNGYVIIPEGHPLHGKGYDQIHDDLPSLSVNGGLTFASDAKGLDWPEIAQEDMTGWVVGFDTCHSHDNLEMWTPEKVEAETVRLREQLEAYDVANLQEGDFTATLINGIYNIYRDVNGSGVFIGSMADRSQFEIFNTQSMDFTDWVCLHRVINKCFEQFK